MGAKLLEEEFSWGRSWADPPPRQIQHVASFGAVIALGLVLCGVGRVRWKIV